MGHLHAFTTLVSDEVVQAAKAIHYDKGGSLEWGDDSATITDDLDIYSISPDAGLPGGVRVELGTIYADGWERVDQYGNEIGEEEFDELNDAISSDTCTLPEVITDDAPAREVVLTAFFDRHANYCTPRGLHFGYSGTFGLDMLDTIKLVASDYMALQIDLDLFATIGELRTHIVRELRNFDVDQLFTQTWSAEFAEESELTPQEYLNALHSSANLFDRLANYFETTKEI